MRLIINVWCGESRTSPPPETTRLTSTVGCSELSANTVGSPGHVCLRGAQEAQLRAHHQHGGDRLRDATVRGDACFEESMKTRALPSLRRPHESGGAPRDTRNARSQGCGLSRARICWPTANPAARISRLQAVIIYWQTGAHLWRLAI
jgi:hypothetical protein